MLSAVLGMAAMLSWSYVAQLGDAMYDGAVGFIVAMPLIIVLSNAASSLRLVS